MVALYLITILIVAAVYVGSHIYAFIYFHSSGFKSIKDSILDYINECNDLNVHIDTLRGSYAVEFHKTDYGEAQFTNTSQWNYKKTGLYAKAAPNIYDCSRTVCDNARKKPFEYICKYFNVKKNEQSLEKLESALNNFLAAENGKVLLQNKRKEIIASIEKDVPWLIRTFFSKKMEKELGFAPFQFNSLYFPTYVFRYRSSGGNSGNQYSITLNIPMLERFITFIGDQVKFRKSAEGQRRLMTPKLRAFIIDRDNHTCKICHNSTSNEPNLLLEVDHIIPLAKGGMTTEDNLQCLCWKCNRSKGAKVG